MAVQFCNDSLLCLVAPSWLLWIVAGLLLNGVVHLKHLLPTVLRGIMEYGKLRLGESKSGLGYFLTLPKRWFTHFYIWGVFWNYSLFIVFASNCIFHSKISIPVIGPIINAITGGLFERECSEVGQHHFDVFLVLFLLCVQVSRRLYECLRVTVFGNSRMHIVHYILGVYFYTAVGLTALLHLRPASQNNAIKTSSMVLLFKQYLKWYHILAVTMFLWAGYHQYNCHKILADLRKPTKQSSGDNNPSSSHQTESDSNTVQPLDSKQALTGESTSQKYGIPTGDWFHYVSCPHLLAEILIYLSLLLCQVFNEPGCGWWLVVAHVTCSLYLSARQMHSWYRHKFDDYPMNRTSLFPWIC